jgi:hypothetical protein
VAVALVSATLAEVFVPALARPTFGRSVTMQPYAVSPQRGAIASFTRLDPGPVLDVPFDLGFGNFWRMADYVLANAYHHRPVAACYNSFHVLVQDDIARYAARSFEEPRAADALTALGIRNIVFHPGARSRILLSAPKSHLTQVATGGGQAIYRTADAPGITSSLDDLAVRIESLPAQGLVVSFTNPTAFPYRHPDPIEPTALVARWVAEDGIAVREDAISMLLPTILAAGDTIGRPLHINVPAVQEVVHLELWAAGRKLAELSSR